MINIESLKNTIKVEESDTDVFVYIGYIKICSIEEENGRWYPSIRNREILSLDGYNSKQDALEAVVNHLSD